MRKTLRLLVPFLTLGLVSPAPARIVEGIAAIVEGEPITLSEVNRFARRLSAVPRADLPAVSERSQLLALLIEERLIEREAEKIGISVSETEVDRAIGDLLQANSFSPGDLAAFLRGRGLSEADYRAEIRRELLKAKLIAREVRPRILLSEEKIHTYYLENQNRFSSPPELRISQIYIRRSHPRAAARIREIERRLASGEDFAELAREFSEDASGRNGGDLGFFAWEDLKPELRSVLEDLPLNQPSPPVPTADGYHILLITERREGGPIPFAQIRNRVVEELYAREVERGFRSWLEKVKSRAKIEIKLGAGN